MNIEVLCDKTLYQLISGYHSFRWNCWLHIQDSPGKVSTHTQISEAYDYITSNKIEW